MWIRVQVRTGLKSEKCTSDKKSLTVVVLCVCVSVRNLNLGTGTSRGLNEGTSE